MWNHTFWATDSPFRTVLWIDFSCYLLVVCLFNFFFQGEEGVRRWEFFFFYFVLCTFIELWISGFFLRFFLISLLFVCLIKVFRFQRKTVLLLFAFSFFTIIIIFLHSTRVFLGHFSVDFREIFRTDVFLWKDFACKISRFISLPVSSYCPFSDFLKVLLVHVSPPLPLKLEFWNFYTR